MMNSSSSSLLSTTLSLGIFITSIVIYRAFSHIPVQPEKEEQPIENFPCAIVLDANELKKLEEDIERELICNENQEAKNEVEHHQFASPMIHQTENSKRVETGESSPSKITITELDDGLSEQAPSVIPSIADIPFKVTPNDETSLILTEMVTEEDQDEIHDEYVNVCFGDVNRPQLMEKTEEIIVKENCSNEIEVELLFSTDNVDSESSPLHMERFQEVEMMTEEVNLKEDKILSAKFDTPKLSDTKLPEILEVKEECEIIPIDDEKKSPQLQEEEEKEMEESIHRSESPLTVEASMSMKINPSIIKETVVEVEVEEVVADKKPDLECCQMEEEFQPVHLMTNINEYVAEEIEVPASFSQKSVQSEPDLYDVYAPSSSGFSTSAPIMMMKETIHQIADIIETMVIPGATTEEEEETVVEPVEEVITSKLVEEELEVPSVEPVYLLKFDEPEMIEELREEQEEDLPLVNHEMERIVEEVLQHQHQMVEEELIEEDVVNEDTDDKAVSYERAEEDEEEVEEKPFHPVSEALVELESFYFPSEKMENLDDVDLEEMVEPVEIFEIEEDRMYHHHQPEQDEPEAMEPLELEPILAEEASFSEQLKEVEETILEKEEEHPSAVHMELITIPKPMKPIVQADPSLTTCTDFILIPDPSSELPQSQQQSSSSMEHHAEEDHNLDHSFEDHHEEHHDDHHDDDEHHDPAHPNQPKKRRPTMKGLVKRVNSLFGSQRKSVSENTLTATMLMNHHEHHHHHVPPHQTLNHHHEDPHPHHNQERRHSIESDGNDFSYLEHIHHSDDETLSHDDNHPHGHHGNNHHHDVNNVIHSPVSFTSEKSISSNNSRKFSFQTITNLFRMNSSNNLHDHNHHTSGMISPVSTGTNSQRPSAPNSPSPTNIHNYPRHDHLSVMGRSASSELTTNPSEYSTESIMMKSDGEGDHEDDHHHKANKPRKFKPVKFLKRTFSNMTAPVQHPASPPPANNQLP